MILLQEDAAVATGDGAMAGLAIPNEPLGLVCWLCSTVMTEAVWGGSQARLGCFRSGAGERKWRGGPLMAWRGRLEVALQG